MFTPKRGEGGCSVKEVRGGAGKGQKQVAGGAGGSPAPGPGEGLDAIVECFLVEGQVLGTKWLSAERVHSQGVCSVCPIVMIDQ